MLLPTSAELLEKLKTPQALQDPAVCHSLLNPTQPQKLLYSLYIVDGLTKQTPQVIFSNIELP